VPRLLRGHRLRVDVGADVFGELGVVRQALVGGAGLPGRGEGLRIVDREGLLQRVLVRQMQLFRQQQVGGMGDAGGVDGGDDRRGLLADQGAV